MFVEVSVEKKEELEEGEEGEGKSSGEEDTQEGSTESLESDPDMRVGGLITPTTELSDIEALVSRDPRWLDCSEALRQEVYFHPTNLKFDNKNNLFAEQ